MKSRRDPKTKPEKTVRERKRKTICFRMKPSLFEALRTLSKDPQYTGKTQTLIHDILESYVDKVGKISQ